MMLIKPNLKLDSLPSAGQILQILPNGVPVLSRISYEWDGHLIITGHDSLIFRAFNFNHVGVVFNIYSLTNIAQREVYSAAEPTPGSGAYSILTRVKRPYKCCSGELHRDCWDSFRGCYPQTIQQTPIHPNISIVDGTVNFLPVPPLRLFTFRIQLEQCLTCSVCTHGFECKCRFTGGKCTQCTLCSEITCHCDFLVCHESCSLVYLYMACHF